MTRHPSSSADGPASRQRATQTSTIIAGVVLAATLIIGFFVIASLGSALPATQTETVTNETITQSVPGTVQVSKAGDNDAEDFKENEIVYNSSSGDTVELTEGTDYQWYTNGTIRFFSTSSTSDGAKANITYTYKTHMDNYYTTVDRIGQGMLIGGVVIIVLFSAVILRTLRGL